MLTQIVILSLVGGLLCLDRIFLQTMLSRPIVMAPVVGLLLGDSYTGLIIGAIFELFWIDRAPIGIYIPPNDSVASAFAAALAILAGQSWARHERTDGPRGPGGRAFRHSGEKNRRPHDGTQRPSFRLGRWKRPGRSTFARLKTRGLPRTRPGVCDLCRPASDLDRDFCSHCVIWLYPKLPVQIGDALTLTYYFLPVLGTAIALSTIKLRGANRRDISGGRFDHGLFSCLLKKSNLFSALT